MKITKGMKLTEEQKAQRAASRERNRKAAAERIWKADVARRLEHQDMLDETDAIISKFKSGTMLKIIVDLEKYPELHRALAYFQRVYLKSVTKPDPSLMASKLLQLVLAHPEQASSWISAHVKYRDAEGFGGMDGADEKIMLARIAGRKEYLSTDE